MSTEPYVPTVADVKSAYVDAHLEDGRGGIPKKVTRAEFDRFLAKIKAEALREAAEQASAPVNRHQWPTPESVADFLRRRADRVEEDA